MNRPEIISSDIPAENKWTRIVREQLRFENGVSGEYIIVERQPALMIIPIIEADGVFYTYMVKQFRHPIGREVWQFPMGTFEEKESYKHEDHAKKELREETGIKANRLIFLGEFFVDPGLSRQKCIAYLAEDIVEGGEQELENTEADLITKRIPVSELDEMCKRGEIVDTWGYSGLFLLTQFLATKQKND